MIQFNCPSCGKAFSVNESLAGKDAKCNVCGARIKIPAASVAATPPPIRSAASAANPQRLADDRVSERLAPQEPVRDRAPPSERAVSPPKLRPCPDCGKMVSLRAPRCPDCGAPLEAREALPPAPRQPPLPIQAHEASERPGYVDENLVEGERVVYRANMHLAVLQLPIAFALLGFVFLLFAVLWVGAAAIGIAAVPVGIATIWGVANYIRLKTSEFAVTNRRVVIKVGVLGRRTLELLLTKVETIGVDQDILGRALNYGVITVTGTGGTKEPFRFVADPLEFRRQVQMLTETRS